MKHVLRVKVDAIKHERSPGGDPFTTLHLELPDGAPYSFLRKAYRITKNKEAREVATFKLQVYGGGDRRTWTLTSKGTKSKDFKVVAVVEVFFNAQARFEKYFDAVEGAAYDAEFIVEIETPSTPLFPKKDDDSDNEGMSA